MLNAFKDMPTLDAIQDFWLSALMQLFNNFSFAELQAYASLHKFDADDIEEFLFYFNYCKNQEVEQEVEPTIKRI